MINLFRFLIRNSSFFLFIIFELIAFYLIVNFNQTQRTIFVNSSNKLTGTLLEKSNRVQDYFHLSRINESLNNENAYLLQSMENLKRQMHEETPRFEYLAAKVISNRIDGRYNRFLLNKGKKEGVDAGMGVLHQNYPVGIVYQVTDHHASAISLLNVNFHLSAGIKDKGYFGLLTWMPIDPTDALLEHIPAHADVQVGDTVVTSGYSQVFPEQLEVGIVEEISTPKGSNLYEMNVRLFVDIGKMEFVQIIENKHQVELDSLQVLIDQ